jgi:hypothetical protein
MLACDAAGLVTNDCKAAVTASQRVGEFGIVRSAGSSMDVERSSKMRTLTGLVCAERFTSWHTSPTASCPPAPGSSLLMN